MPLKIVKEIVLSKNSARAYFCITSITTLKLTTGLVRSLE